MRAKSLRSTLIAVALVTIAACATTVIDLPPVTEEATTERMPGKMVWHDLLTHDIEGSKAFYGELFGWTFESIGTDGGAPYTLIRHNGRAIGGMVDTLQLNGRDDISQWIALMSVVDIDSATRKFVDDGGQLITPPTDLQRRGRMAVVRDAEGALLGLLQTRDGDPADREPQLNDFLWNELWTDDVGSATDFYSELSGLDVDSIENGQGQEAYQLLKAGDKPRSGIMRTPLEGLEPVWVSYLRVENPSAITKQVESLGGRILADTQPRPAGGEVAFVAGPSGAGIALQTWPLDKNLKEST